MTVDTRAEAASVLSSISEVIAKTADAPITNDTVQVCADTILALIDKKEDTTKDQPT